MKATNNFLWIIRDKTESEKSGFIIPSEGREKPHQGTVVSVGILAQDGNIKNSKGKKVLFHKTVGWEMEFEGQTYLICEAHQIIGIV